MQSPSGPHPGWLSGVADAPAPARDRAPVPGAPLVGFAVALSLLVVYICSPWMG